MAKVVVTFDAVGASWISAGKQAVTDLNAIFKKKGVGVVLALTGDGVATITVKVDRTIQGTAVHGRTSASTDGSGHLLSAEVKLPEKAIINTPAGTRDVGAGILKVIVAHEFVHALGQVEHTTHLMAQTMTKYSGDTPAGDKLQADGISLPPIALAADSIDLLKSIWN